MIFRFVFRATHGLARLGKERTELFDEVYIVDFTNTASMCRVVRCSSKHERSTTTRLPYWCSKEWMELHRNQLCKGVFYSLEKKVICSLRYS